MLKSLAVAAAQFAFVTSALETTSLDMNELYKSVMPKSTMLAQIGSSSATEWAVTSNIEPICTLRVHTVKPMLDIPKLPSVDYSMQKEIPSFLKRRLARRYEDRDEEVPDYLKPEQKENEPEIAPVSKYLRAQ